MMNGRAVSLSGFDILSSLWFRHSSFFKRVVKHFVHERAINRVNRRIHIKRLRGLAAFLVTDHVAHAAANVIIHDETGVDAHAWLGIKAGDVLLAAQWTDDQEASALEHIHRLAQRDPTDDSSEFHFRRTGVTPVSFYFLKFQLESGATPELRFQILFPGSDSSTMPTISQRTGLFSTPTALRAAMPSDEITTCWCMPAPCESIATIGVPSGCPAPLIGWQITRRHASKLGCFRVATMLPSTRASNIN